MEGGFWEFYPVSARFISVSNFQQYDFPSFSTLVLNSRSLAFKTGQVLVDFRL